MVDSIGVMKDGSRKTCGTVVVVSFHCDTVGAHVRVDDTLDEASPRRIDSGHHSRKHASVGPQDLWERNRN